MLMGPKRSSAAMEEAGPTASFHGNKMANNDASSTSPYMSAFEQFRSELDEHHDRRERIIKASRDVTAASKKM